MVEVADQVAEFVRIALRGRVSGAYGVREISSKHVAGVELKTAAALMDRYRTCLVVAEVLGRKSPITGRTGLLTLASIPAGFALGFALSLLLSRFFTRELFRLPLVVNAR